MNGEEKIPSSKILYGAEGLMLPAKAELNMAAKSKFDLFTITNLSFWDLALYHRLKLNVFAVSKEEMGGSSKQIKGFEDIHTFAVGDHSDFHNYDHNSEEYKKEIDHIDKMPNLHFKYDAEFDLKVYLNKNNV